MSLAIDLLLANLDLAYEQKAWHGANLRAAIRGLGADEVLWRPAKGRHNIWELTAHAAYWKYAVRRRLTDEKRGGFPIKGSNWFPAPAAPDVVSWRAVIALLDAEHRSMRAVIAALTDRDLRDAKRRRMLTGAAAHDLYHAGQIQLIKRLMRA